MVSEPLAGLIGRFVVVNAACPFEATATVPRVWLLAVKVTLPSKVDPGVGLTVAVRVTLAPWKTLVDDGVTERDVPVRPVFTASAKAVAFTDPRPATRL